MEKQAEEKPVGQKLKSGLQCDEKKALAEGSEPPAFIEDIGQENQKPWITPFYALRSFLDAEYSVILAYGFYLLAEQVISIRGLLKPLLANSPFDILAFVEVIVGDEFINKASIIVSIIIVFVMLVDDFSRRRILTAAAPCRSIRRFSYDVGIGFFFILAFMFLPIQSSLAWGSVGLAYLCGALWGHSALRDSLEWEKCPESADPRTCARVGNWEHHISRVEFIKSSNFLFGCIIIITMVVIILYDSSKSHYGLFMFIFFLEYMICETIRFFGENRLMALHVEESQQQGFRGTLTTIAPIPRIVQQQIKDYAMKPRNRSSPRKREHQKLSDKPS